MNVFDFAYGCVWFHFGFQHFSIKIIHVGLFTNKKMCFFFLLFLNEFYHSILILCYFYIIKTIKKYFEFVFVWYIYIYIYMYIFFFEESI